MEKLIGAVYTHRFSDGLYYTMFVCVSVMCMLMRHAYGSLFLLQQEKEMIWLSTSYTNANKCPRKVNPVLIIQILFEFEFRISMVYREVHDDFKIENNHYLLPGFLHIRSIHAFHAYVPLGPALATVRYRITSHLNQLFPQIIFFFSLLKLKTNDAAGNEVKVNKIWLNAWCIRLHVMGISFFVSCSTIRLVRNDDHIFKP